MQCGVIPAGSAGFSERAELVVERWQRCDRLWDSLGSCELSSAAAQKGLVSANRGLVGLTGNGAVGGEEGGDWALLCCSLQSPGAVYAGWRFNSLTISRQICYCSLLEALTEGIRAGRRLLRRELQWRIWLLPLSSRILPVWLECGKPLHPPAHLIIQSIILHSPWCVTHQGEWRGWKLAEGIPSHGAPDLSITFQLANELQHHKGSSRSQPGRAEPAGTSTSSQTAMKLTEYNQITISDPSNGSSCEAGPPDGR